MPDVTVNENGINKADLQTVKVPERLTTKKGRGVEIKLHAFYMAPHGFECHGYSSDRDGLEPTDGLLSEERRQTSIRAPNPTPTVRSPRFLSAQRNGNSRHPVIKCPNKLSLIHRFDFINCNLCQAASTHCVCVTCQSWHSARVGCLP